MGRQSKGTRLHKFNHRPNWFIRSSGKPDFSTGTVCFGAALRMLHEKIAMDERDTARECGEIPASFINMMIRKSAERASMRGLEHSINAADIHAMIAKQGGCCALSGMEFSLEKSTSGNRKPFAPSIDRIDSKNGYTLENCRIVASIVNLARNDFSDDEFFLMCKRVADRGRGF